MDDVRLIDSCRLKALLQSGHDLGLIQTIEDVDAYIDECQVSDLALWPNMNRSFTSLRTPINGGPECLK